MPAQSKPETSSVVALFQAGVDRVMPIWNTAYLYGAYGAGAAKSVLDKYPPVKAFVYTLGATSAFPLLCFGGFATATLAGCVAVAGTGVAFVQGGFLLFGGFFAFWFLLGSFIFTCFASFWFTMSYFALQVAKRIEGSAR
ncbi:hypothetical protein HK101_004931 [Irineochytrium annulatum]|nr:hypothetical protein HK101_004931 [Irineochytrium annulatum]